MERVGGADGRSRGHQGRVGARLPLRHLNVIGAGRRERMAQAGVRRRTAVARIVVVLHHQVIAAVVDPQDAVEAGVVDVEKDGLSRQDGHGVVFQAAMAGGHDGGVGDGGGVGHVRPRAEIEGAGQRHRVSDRIVGRPLRLDDVGRAAAFTRRAGEQLVGAAAAIQGVDAAAAAQDVGVGVAGEGVRMGGAEHLLDAAQRVGTRPAAGETGREVDRHAGPGVGVVGDVVADSAVDRVVAAATDQMIVAVAAVEHVVAGTAVQRIDAGQAVDGVIAAEAADGVAESRAGDGFVGDVAANQQSARGRRRNGLVRELEEFDVADGDRLAEPGDGPDLAVPSDHIVGARAPEHDRIRAEAAVDLVVAAVAGDEVGRGVAPDGVCA